MSTNATPDIDTTPGPLAGKHTANEVAGSLTGYDEIAITQAFGNPLEELSQLTVIRALLFVLRRREGMGDHAARAVAMHTTQQAAQDYLADEPDDLEVDEGKAPTQ